jgi:hypothetical protein
MPKTGVAKAGVAKTSIRNEPTKGRMLTQHTGLPPRKQK